MVGVNLAAALPPGAPNPPAAPAPEIELPNQNREFNLATIDLEDSVKYIRDLDSSKSSGVCNLRSQVIKDALLAKPEVGQKLINCSISSSTFPRAWKTGRVIPLAKSGDLSKVGNWRPVCLLNICSKLCEKVVHKQLMDC